MKAHLYDPERNSNFVGDLTKDVVDRSVQDWPWRRLIVKLLSKALKHRCCCNVLRWETLGAWSTVAGGTWHTIPFTTETIRGMTATSPTTGWQFRCEATGVYHVSALLALRLNPVGIGVVNDGRLALFRNGSWYSHLDVTPATNLRDVCFRGSDHIILNCGDVLEIKLDAGTGAFLAADVEQSYGYVGLHVQCQHECVGQINNTANNYPSGGV